MFGRTFRWIGDHEQKVQQKIPNSKHQTVNEFELDDSPTKNLGKSAEVGAELGKELQPSL